MIVELIALIFCGTCACYGWASFIRDIALYLEKRRNI